MQATTPAEVVQGGLSAGARQALAMSIVRWEAATGGQPVMAPPRAPAAASAWGAGLQVGSIRTWLRALLCGPYVWMKRGCTLAIATINLVKAR